MQTEEEIKQLQEHFQPPQDHDASEDLQLLVVGAGISEGTLQILANLQATGAPVGEIAKLIEAAITHGGDDPDVWLLIRLRRMIEQEDRRREALKRGEDIEIIEVSDYDPTEGGSYLEL